MLKPVGVLAIAAVVAEVAARTSARSTVRTEVAVGAVAFADSRFDVAGSAAPAVVFPPTGGH